MSAVFHRKLPTELQVMPLNLRVMAIVGLWENHEKLYRFVFVLFWTSSIILFPKAVLGIGSDRFDAIAKGWSEFIYQGNLIVAAAIFATKRTYFKQVIDLLTDIIYQVTNNDQLGNCYEEIREQNSRINKFVKFYVIYCCAAPFLFCIPPVTTSYFQYLAAGGNDSKELQFELPMEQKYGRLFLHTYFKVTIPSLGRFYGMQIRTNFVHYNIFIVLSLCTYCGCALLSIIKVPTMIIMMKYCAMVYRLIEMQTQDLNKLPKNTPKAPKLARIVCLHDSALKVTQLTEEILNIPLMMQFMSTVLFWCLAMLYMSTNQDFSLLNVMVTFCLSLVETYSYSYLGSQLTDEAAAIGRAIYHGPWYEESVEMQNQYRMVLRRSQRETGITAAKFFFVSINHFGSIAQMSYSYYLVLKKTVSVL